MNQELYELLEDRYYRYNNLEFIENDPIQIPHRFSKKQDIEISGLLTATISWGNRKSIIKNASNWMNIMDNEPYDFHINASEREFKKLKSFVHRTFNGNDAYFFSKALSGFYKKHDSLETAFSFKSNEDLASGIENFRRILLELKHEKRFEKHVSSPLKNSSAKRICMYLRWMVRGDNSKVDFGIWKNIKSSNLKMPLDVHTGTVGRYLGLLKRQQNDWKSVLELTESLKEFDSKDPVKYDFALFGMGVGGELKS